LWRSPGVLQVELAERAIVIEQVSSDHISAILPRRPGTKRDGATPAEVSVLRDVLDEAGFIADDMSVDPWATPTAGVPGYLAAEQLALRSQYPDQASTMLQGRRQRAVTIQGSSRLAVTVAATLGAAGIGAIHLGHGGDVSAADSCPGGLLPADEGTRFAVAGVNAIRRTAPDVDTSPIPLDRLPDLVILADHTSLDPVAISELELDQVPHLSVAVTAASAVIGPLVLPGTSSCLRCADLHRHDRDPAWPALAVQLGARSRHASGSNVALCLAAAGVAASQALAYVDGQRPATLNGTLEWQLPDWRLRRRTWSPHHGCGCGAAPTIEHTAEWMRDHAS
jgi:bacteriocin biosynthesis cyclodehydratase domain-containing protein